MIPRLPIIVVLGATGSGKSKLAIEIAKIFNGEIVSADSMQLYKGLDVITNKVTAEERRMVPHHMLDFLEPHVSLNVVDYRNMALRKVEEIMAKGKLPLVVGGTNYYIESLLWKVLVAAEVNKATQLEGGRDGDEVGMGRCEGSSEAPEGVDEEEVGTDECEFGDVPSGELHKRLAEVDPEMAKLLHPNNRRKIVRSLEVYKQVGRRHSELLKEQRKQDGGGSLGGPLRFSNSCILWLRCNPEVLDKRLDDRVDDMLKNGLIDEMLDFHRRYNANRLKANPNSPPDYTRGIFQSIGFKEFHEYLMMVEKEGVDKGAEENKEGGGDPKSEELFRKGVEMLKLATRRYARKQVRWINNRFLRRPDRQVPPVYGLDATDPSRWDELVLTPASEIVRTLMTGKMPEGIAPLPFVSREDLDVEWDGEPKECDVCNRIFVDPVQWKVHLKSKKHKKMVQKRKALPEERPEEESTKRTKLE
ncbi:tRNA dimethylallyltransferase [Hetaerina americana]|uniref:tRNA dimethylallyltransferase n=1 Tax=Hetaerina americana TaxID=62018 RepID=UPI003A7F629B